jgi:hypothetical protein
MQSTTISADEAHAVRASHLRSGPDGKELLMKVASAPASWNPGTRSARFTMTAQSEDRYKDIVVTDGIDLTQFALNPVAPLQHNSGSWPIGDWANVEKMTRKRPPRMEGDLVLHEAGGPIPEIEQAAWMIERGYMRACSIGFLPDWNEVEKALDKDGAWSGGLKFNRSELLECSLCSIPALPGALAKGLFDGPNMAQEAIERILDGWARGADGTLLERGAFEDMYEIIKRGEGGPEMVETYLSQMDEESATAVCEKFIIARGKAVVSQNRLENIERAARNKRLAEKRQREIDAMRARARAEF